MSYIDLRTHIYTALHRYTNVCMCVYVYVCVYVCMCVYVACVCMCVFVYIHTYRRYIHTCRAQAHGSRHVYTYMPKIDPARLLYILRWLFRVVSPLSQDRDAPPYTTLHISSPVFNLCLHAHLYVYLHVHAHVCVHYVCAYVYTHMCMYIHVYVYLCVCVCVCSLCVCMYVCERKRRRETDTSASMLEKEVFISELSAVDRLAASAVLSGEVSSLPQHNNKKKHIQNEHIKTRDT
jgi:hypothetical protein